MEPVQNDKGEWVIPASKRPDGTWRKEKVLKGGYVPQDEVKAFETRASKSVIKKGIPGMPPPAAKPVPNPKPEAKKKTEKEFSNLMVSMSLNVPQRVEAVTADVSVPEQKDPSKRLKALKKKLREIEELVGKKREDLSKEQAEKVDKKVSIEAEIKSLESIES